MSWFANLYRSLKTNAPIHRLIWWMGVPVVIALADALPFLVIRCGLHLSSYGPCWRLPVAGSVIFDGYVYRQFMGMAASGVGDSYHVGLFAFVIRLVHSALPFLYNTELWLVLTWISGVLSVWVGAWMLGSLSTLSQSGRRLASGVLWIAIFLTLGFRPGVFSWFLPFGLVMLAACAKTLFFSKEKRWQQAVLWSFVALLCSFVYSWFFLFAAFWIGSVWALAASRELKRGSLIILWLASASIAITSVVGLLTFFPERVARVLETLLRNGAAFTHAPVVTNLLIAAFLWLAVMITAAREHTSQEAARIDCFLVMGWIVTILGWCSSLATGLYLHNDHFRIFVLLFAWMSAVVLIERKIMHPDVSMLGSKTSSRVLVGLAAIMATVVSCSYIAKPYALDHDQLNAIHLAVWASLAIVGCIALSPRRMSARGVAIIFALFATGVGVPQYLATFANEASITPAISLVTPSIIWIRSQIPPVDQVCISSVHTDLMGAATGRALFFSGANTLVSGSDENLRQQLKTYASFIPVSGSTLAYWKDQLSGPKESVCHQFQRQRRIFQRRLSEEQIDRMFGCSRDVLEREHRFLESMTHLQAESTQGITQLCPWILLDKHSLNTEIFSPVYTRAYEDGKVTIFKRSSSPE